MSGFAAPCRSRRRRSAASAGRSRCASFRPPKTRPPPNPGARRSPRAPRSSKCRQAASPWSMPMACATPASGATSCARAWPAKAARARGRGGWWGELVGGGRARKGVAALVSDGVVRDLAGVLSTGLPIWAAGTAAPPSVAALTFVAWQQPVGCGGVAVFPDDVIVADRDGAVLIPAALLGEVAAQATEQERLEDWIMQQVQSGAALPGLYPPDAGNRARYEAGKAAP